MKTPQPQSTKDSAAEKRLGGQSAAGLECVVIGGSAGSIEGLTKLLPPLSADFPLPIVVVVHLPPEGKSLLPEIFAPRCHLTVKEAEDKEPICRGMIYFAAPNYHLLVETDQTLSLSSDEPVLFSRPSIDVLFESAADAFGSALLGVVLTGASSDGTAGSQAILAAGGAVWVQQPEAGDAALMPKSVLETCPQAHAFALPQLAQKIEALGKRR